MKPHIIMLFVSFLVGCVTTSERDTVMNSWVGKPIDRLVFKWGSPDSKMALGNGKEVLTWIRSGIYTDSDYKTSSYSCRRSFLISDNTVQDWSAVGDCRRLDSPTSIFCMTDTCINNEHKLAAD